MVLGVLAVGLFAATLTVLVQLRLPRRIVSQLAQAVLMLPSAIGLMLGAALFSNGSSSVPVAEISERPSEIVWVPLPPGFAFWARMESQDRWISIRPFEAERLTHGGGALGLKIRRGRHGWDYVAARF
jgi:hypothetical protein